MFYSHTHSNLFNKLVLMESSTWKQHARAHTWIFPNKEEKEIYSARFPKQHLMLENKFSPRPPQHHWATWCSILHVFTLSFVVFVYTHRMPNNSAPHLFSFLLDMLKEQTAVASIPKTRRESTSFAQKCVYLS